MSTHGINYQMVTAIAAMALSLCALVISLYEVRVMRADQHAQVWPYVEIDREYDAQGFRLIAKNKGTGPARILSLHATLAGASVQDWDEIIERVLGKETDVDYRMYKTTHLNGQVLPSESEELIFGVPWNDQTRRLEVAFRDLEFEVCYCSVLNDCWSVRAGQRDAAVCDTEAPSQFDRP